MPLLHPDAADEDGIRDRGVCMPPVVPPALINSPPPSSPLLATVSPASATGPQPWVSMSASSCGNERKGGGVAVGKGDGVWS